MLQNIKQFIRDEEGATAIEYGLIVGLIAVVLVIVLGLVGTNLTTLFQSVVTALQGAVAAG